MISKNVFLVEEMPFQKLEKIGISKEDVLNFPRQLLEPLSSGGVTPLIMGTVTKDTGEKVDIPLKLQLLRGKDNSTVNVLAYPMRKEILNDRNFSRAEIESLKKGDVLKKEVKENDHRTQKFFQLDRETNSIIQKDALTLRLSDRIKEIEKIGSIELGLNQKKAIHEGKPVELQTGDTKVTVGVDLKQPIGFKSLQGDLQDWKEKQAREYDLLNPGFMGYVKTEQNRWEYQQILFSLQSKETKQINSNSLKVGL